MNTGWIKLYRSLRNHWIFEKPNYLKAWLIILLEVNHSDKKVLVGHELIECKRGESLNSLNTWTALFGKGWSKQATRTFFKLLEKDHMITTKGLIKTTRLTVCNYESYQDEQHTTNTQLTHKQHATNTQLTSNKNDKNDKNDKNIYNQFLTIFNSIKKSKFRGTKKDKSQFNARIKEGFTLEEFETAIKNCYYDPYHIENPNYLTPEFITRSDKLDKYLNYSAIEKYNKEKSSGKKESRSIKINFEGNKDATFL